MKIDEFVSGFSNHPILFIGAGISMRYLEGAYSWDGLLEKIAYELKGTDEYYLELKSQFLDDSGVIDFPSLGTELEIEFNKTLSNDRNGKFKSINDIFFQKMREEVKVSRFKLYIAELLSKQKLKDTHEISEFSAMRKNIASVITTNYDTFIEDSLNFKPLIGNSIILSNPYGSVYKIHGCVTSPKDIILTKEDYNKFDNKYDLIRAELLSMFIHNPIVFLGYSISDDNIKQILSTIFKYVDPKSDEAEKIRRNFLLVEYDPGSINQDVVEHDVDIGDNTIRINRIKTDDFCSIYKSIQRLVLPVSAMDIRKVSSIVRDICIGNDSYSNSIKVSIADDVDDLKNSDTVLAIGSSRTIAYTNIEAKNFISSYFSLLEKPDPLKLKLLEDIKISKNQYFPVFGFSKYYNIKRTDDSNVDALKKRQKTKIDYIVNKCDTYFNNKQTTLDNLKKAGDEGLDDFLKDIPDTRQIGVIIYAAVHNYISLSKLLEYVNMFKTTPTETYYKQLLVTYDYLKYGR